jgi:hypothetical protein
MLTQTLERQKLRQVIDALPDNSVVTVLDFVKGLRLPPAPESITAHSKEELYEMLEAGEEQVKAGRVIDADVVMTRIKNEYGF